MRSDFASALALALLAASPSFAADHLVGPVGSGATYAKIQDAIDAALPGDRVLVLPGTYVESVVIGKPIELVGSGSSASIIRPTWIGLPGLVAQPLRATGVPAGTRLRIAGLQVSANGASTFSAGICPLLVHDTQGVVELADLALNAVGFPLLASDHEVGVLSLRDAAQVVLDNVRANAGGSPVFGTPGGTPFVNGMHGLVALRSRVWVNESSFYAMGGSAPLSPQGGFPGAGGHGVLAIDALVQFARVHARGGQAGGVSPAQALPGGVGLEARNSSVRVHGGSKNRCEGAQAAVVTFVFVTSYGSAGPALRLDATSAYSRAPDVVLVPGAAVGPMPRAVLSEEAPGSTHTVLAEQQPSMTLAPTYASLGAPITVNYEGQPGGVHLRGIAIASAPAFSLPGITGSVLLDLGSLLFAPAVVIAADGTAQQQTAVPNFAGFAGIAFVEQSVQVTGLGLALAPPVVLTVGF